MCIDLTLLMFDSTGNAYIFKNLATQLNPCRNMQDSRYTCSEYMIIPNSQRHKIHKVGFVAERQKKSIACRRTNIEVYGNIYL